jgi:3-dehydroquinate synthase
MQTIQANGYPVLFGEKEYETLNTFIENNKYSSLFILVDNHSNELCLLRFLSFLATDKTI